MLETYIHEEVGAIKCCNGITSVYVFEINGMKSAGYLSHIGSAMAGGDVIEANWITGASKFIMFGSAGSLDSEATNGKFVIPTESYREDGLSYNYAASALATVTAQTRQSADSVGTAFKTLFSRLESLNLGESLDDGVTLNKYSKALATVGVNVLDATGKLKDMDTILDDLGGKWENLTSA